MKNRLTIYIVDCEYKHRLLFFDLQYLHFLAKLFEHLQQTKNIRAQQVIQQGQVLYKQIDTLLEQQDNYEQLISANYKLEKILGLTYRVRQFLLEELYSIAETQELDDLILLLENLDNELDSIIYQINLQQDVDEQVRLQFLHQLNQLPISLLPIPNLNNYFKQDYDVALTQQGRLDWLSDWLSILQTRTTGWNFQRPNTLQHVLQVKALIYDTKSQHVINHYQHLWQHTARHHLQQRILAQTKMEDILTALETETLQLQQAITAIEDSLTTYNSLLAVLSSGYRLWTLSHYRYLANLLLPSMQEVAIKSGLDLTLQPFYQRLFTELAAGGMLTLDLISNRYLGCSFTLLQSLTQNLLNDIAGLGKFMHRVGVSEANVVYALPLLRWISGLAIQLMLASYHLQPDVFVGLMVAYLMGTLSQHLCSQWLGQEQTANQQAITSFKHYLSQYFSFISGAFLGQSLYHQFISYTHLPTEETLLANSRLCQEYSAQCEQVALRKLGLTQNEADWQSIRRQWRKLAKEYHPDIDNFASAQSLFKQANQAKQRLLELRNHCLDSQKSLCSKQH